ncbi:coagulation factor IX-like [Myxocyprinus asiaticus]|uniref:coagulation factor IX-like n=1 Tax=Myxocyprinus asiaticus TaxID=70543 RepID=UPI00222396E1|nr:coagulation factor IX-like [Myxocyprinus asiaticus]
MVKIYPILICGVLLETWLSSAASVFLPRELAGSLLKRQKRFNTGRLEEMMKDNLERECIEERCSLEEAREVFEHLEQTRKFWISYIDGDQCQSSPCQNGGICKDEMSTYTCWCPAGFNGKNCELEMRKQCNVNNGGCMHFCFVDPIYGAVCDCADGYRLALDSRTCEPTGKYPCGRLGDIVGSLKTRSLTSAENGNLNFSVSHANTTDYNATEISPTDNTTETSPADPPAVYNTTTPRPMLENIISWAFFPTLPTIKNATKNVQRIVGGNEATPGEIPWQVVLMHKLNKMAFCGGSILNEDWVITAAHCIEERIGTFFIRAGEHDITKKEGKESDYDIAEYHIHPHYNTKKGLFNHDIALLKLQSPIQFSDYALPICLGSKDFTEKLLSSAPNSLVSGWGSLRYGGIESNTLQKVEVPYVDRTECKTSSTDKITRFMFCAGYTTAHKDSCQGDSGGPHATHYQNTWFLTGIVSWGDECAKDGKYGIYTRVSRYMYWISKITGIRIGHMSNNDKESMVQTL